MTKSIAFLAFLCLLFPGQVSAQLEDIIVEQYTSLLVNAVQPAGTVTYRLYAKMSNGNDLVSAAFGNSCHPLDVSTSTSFFNNSFAGISGADINWDFFPIFPDVEFDSWVSINVTHGLGPNSGDLSTSSSPSTAFSTPLGFPGTGSLILQNGAWFALPSSPLTFPTGPDNTVLLGQFTTDGEFSFNLNLQVYLGGDLVNGRIDYVWDESCAGGGTLSGYEVYHESLTEIVGCLDPTSPCYNPDATYDICTSTPEYPTLCNDPEACNFDPVICTDNVNCFYGCGCNDPEGCNYEPEDLGTDECVFNYGCDAPTACNYSVQVCFNDGSCIYNNGCSDLTACNYDATVCFDDGSCAYNNGCTDIGACNYNAEVCFDDGSCNYFNNGCLDPTACNYDSGACADDGSCTYINGCIDNTACNYDNTACIDDGSCTYNNGCTDNTACNYNSGACFDDGSCTYINGCTDNTACNYDNTACFDDGSCVYINGCTDNTACNFDDMACTDDGSCTYINGCIDNTACNYDNTACIDDGSCTYNNGCTDNTACNYDNTACVDDGSCSYGTGCTDNTACNYDPNACFDDGSCIIESAGCLDPLFCDYNPDACIDGGCVSEFNCNDEAASNYNPAAICNVGCLYSLGGLVFNDANANGVFDIGENPLSGEIIYVEPGGYVAITDDNGEFLFDLPIGEFTITSEMTPQFPVSTTILPIFFNTNFGSNTDLVIGKTFDVQFGEFGLITYPEWAGIICDLINDQTLCIENLGNYPLEGYIEFVLPQEVQSIVQIDLIDSIANGAIYFGFEDLIPGEQLCLNVGLEGPNFELMGDTITFVLNVYGFYQGTLVAQSQLVREFEILCAYDPNDKQSFPFGYSEPHYVEPEEELEYLVRFQNTGNFQAFNVLVRDTISEDLDLNSFELVAHSHSVQTFINPSTREIQFYFENINLPDSNCCEPESHGFFSYRIAPLNDLSHDTRIENTAHIYFDSNPAVVTNTTWNTVFRCDDSFAVFEASASEICTNEEVSFLNEIDHLDAYSWSINNEVLGTDSLLTVSFADAGEYTIELTTQNPFCSSTQSTQIDILASPDVQVSENQSICIGDEVVLTASGAETFNWGEFGETESIAVSPTETTTYQVTGSNDIECTTTVSVEVAVSEYPDLSVSQNAEICQGEEITLNASGAEVYDWDGLGTTAEISVSPMETTIYEVTGTNGIDCSSSASVLVEVFESPVLDVTEGAEICEGEEVVLGASGADTYDWDGLGTTAEITVSPTETTTYEVTGFNEINCSTVAEVTVTVNQTPEASFLDNGNVLTASDGNAWQWYLNGEAIEGATNQTYEVLEDGNYSVEVYSEAGCLGVSAEVNVIYVGIAELNASELKLFPVPVNGNGILNITGVNVSELTNLQIIDASGRMVWNSSKGVSQIALNGLAAGNYVFSAQQNEQLIRIQFVIQ
jgi:uncharacterized repeat protein (TIGR01451 family)